MNKTLLIIKREFLSRVKKKSFLLTTILTPILIPALLGGIIYLAVKDSESEKEVISIMVSDEMTDMVFETLYFAGKFNTPGMGIIFVMPVSKAGTYVPDKLLKGEPN